MKEGFRWTIQHQDILAAWQTQMKKLGRTPWLLRELLQHGPDISVRFGTYYTWLRALPRRVRRALQSRLAQSLAGVALVLALGQGAALAATINVTGGCTLVDAITAANTNTATGGCPAGSGADTLVLNTGNTHTLTTVNNSTYVYGNTGLPVVRSEIIIQGNGSTLTRSSASNFRIFLVNSLGKLTLQDTTISGGRTSGSGSSTRAGDGGGILNYGGIVVLERSTVSGNRADSGGGGVTNLGSSGTSAMLTLTDSTVSGNSASQGGGIRSRVFSSGASTVTLTNSTISGNSGFNGGGVLNDNGTVILTNSTVSGNAGCGVKNDDGAVTLTNSTVSDNGGGGVDNDGGRVTLTNSTVSGNRASKGGGIRNRFGTVDILINTVVSGNMASEDGGGVSNESYSTVTLTNSTVSGNSARGDGGGIYNDIWGSATLTNSTVSDNTANGGGGIYNGGRHGAARGFLVLINSTVSGNSAGVGGGVFNQRGRVGLTNSTVSGNSASSGGGMDIRYGSVTLTSSTVSGNTASGSGGGGGISNLRANLTFIRSLVSGNTAPSEPEVGNGFQSTATANAFNLFGVNGNAGVTGFTPGATDIVPAAGVMLSDILVPTLAPNGGPTRTHALVSGSPAIDASPADGNCRATDQRGVTRPQGTACDIGAFEVSVGPPVCGNGSLDSGEQCDDGNLVNGDCCSSLCQEEDLGDMTCGVGACLTTVAECVDGESQICIPGTPGAETCNGIDDDCDGAVDDNSSGVGQSCSTGQPGVCSAGTTMCTSGAPTCQPTTPPSTERCDSLDNDCDGAVDDSPTDVGQACSTGQPGVCSVGTTVCTSGAPTCQPTTAASTEVCDGLDNDCNGAIDEGGVCPPPPAVHDLAVTNIIAPKTVILTTAKPQQAKSVKVQIQNRSPHNEVLTTFAGLVNLTLDPLKTGTCSPAVSLSAKQLPLPKILKPKQKMNVNFNVTFACALDPAKSTPPNPGHEDFRYKATVNHAAVDRQPDTHGEDDECPRGALGIDPHPDGSITDTGCAEKIADVVDNR